MARTNGRVNPGNGLAPGANGAAQADPSLRSARGRALRSRAGSSPHPSALPFASLEGALAELQAENAALRDRVAALEVERDGQMRGIEVLTHGLRRRGCCDHEPSNGSL
ncbi:MAG: hypothetical protein WEE64_14315 [Dehalococcoidia bacterium]